MKQITSKSITHFGNDYNNVNESTEDERSEFLEDENLANEEKIFESEPHLHANLNSDTKINYINWYFAGNLGDDLLLINYISKTNFDKYVILDTKYSPKESKEISKNAIMSSKELLNKNIFFSNDDISSFSPKKDQRNFVTYIGGSIWPENNIQNRVDEIRKIKNMGVKIIFFGNNLSVYSNEENYDLVSSIFKNADFFSVRDKFSCDKIESCNSFYHDPIYSMKIDVDFSEEVQDDYVAITAAKAPDNFNFVTENSIQELVINIIEKHSINSKLKLISFQNYRDISILESIRDCLIKANYKNDIEIIEYNGNWKDIVKLLANSKLNICTRFHSIIISNMFRRKTLPIIYDNKSYNHLEDIGKKTEIFELTESEISLINELSEKQFEILDEIIKINQ